MLGEDGFGGATQDTSSLTFTLTLPDGSNGISFSWMFGSEEYPHEDVNDVAAVFVDGVNVLSLNGGNVGFFIGENDGSFYDNTVGTDGTSPLAIEYDGMTAPYHVEVYLDPEVTEHTIKIAVSDTSDSVVDSGLFIGDFQFESDAVAPFEPLLLSDLNGDDGYCIDGAVDSDGYGWSLGFAVGIGDINGDGLADVFVGAPYTYGGGFEFGEAFVIFGGSGAGADGTFDAASVNGVTGFRIPGIDYYQLLGQSISTGDLNGDGIDDLLLGDAGTVVAIFGELGIGDSGIFDIESLDGETGFTVEVNTSYEAVSVAAADVNGDGYDDLIIDDDDFNPVYVIFGGDQFDSDIFASSMSSDVGFSLVGASESVAAGGDVNGDNVADFAVVEQAWNGSVAQVVFGNDLGGEMVGGTLTGGLGFSFDPGERGYGASVALADVNGDGLADIIVGVPYAGPLGSEDTYTGQVYVVFGGSAAAQSGVVTPADLDGANGFIIGGRDDAAFLGASVAAAGDVNGDGFEDFLIGAPGYDSAFPDPGWESEGTIVDPDDGVTYHVYVNGAAKLEVQDGIDVTGIDTFDGTVALGSLATGEGVFLDDSFAGGQAGSAVAGGRDVDGDGTEDFLVGAPLVAATYEDGKAYLVYGDGIAAAGTLDNDDYSVELTGHLSHLRRDRHRRRVCQKLPGL